MNMAAQYHQITPGVMSDKDTMTITLTVAEWQLITDNLVMVAEEIPEDNPIERIANYIADELEDNGWLQ